MTVNTAVVVVATTTITIQGTTSTTLTIVDKKIEDMGETEETTTIMEVDSREETTVTVADRMTMAMVVADSRAADMEVGKMMTTMAADNKAVGMVVDRTMITMEVADSTREETIITAAGVKMITMADPRVTAMALKGATKVDVTAARTKVVLVVALATVVAGVRAILEVMAIPRRMTHLAMLLNMLPTIDQKKATCTHRP